MVMSWFYCFYLGLVSTHSKVFLRPNIDYRPKTPGPTRTTPRRAAYIELSQRGISDQSTKTPMKHHTQTRDPTPPGWEEQKRAQTPKVEAAEEEKNLVKTERALRFPCSLFPFLFPRPVLFLCPLPLKPLARTSRRPRRESDRWRGRSASRRWA